MSELTSVDIVGVEPVSTRCHGTYTSVTFIHQVGGPLWVVTFGVLELGVTLVSFRVWDASVLFACMCGCGDAGPLGARAARGVWVAAHVPDGAGRRARAVERDAVRAGVRVGAPVARARVELQDRVTPLYRLQNLSPLASLWVI